MMGRQTADQAQLFYSFNLDEGIPKTHLLRRIDVFVGRKRLLEFIASWPATTAILVGPRSIPNF